MKNKWMVVTLISGIILGVSIGVFISVRFNIEKNGYSQSSFEAAKSIEKKCISVAQEVGKCVVSISTIATERVGIRRFYFGTPFEDDFFRRFFEEFFGESPFREYKRMGLGSGLIIDSQGYILTNEHVIAGADKIKVTLSDGREFDAEVVGKDFRSDLAVIKIEAHNLPTAELGDSDEVKIGEFVLAIGNPFGFAIENPEPTVTFGVVSALHRSLPRVGRRDRAYYDLIQTDAAINPGNSGGPLVDLNGKVIGINVAIITTTGGYEGLGFAIPINVAKRIISKLIKGEEIFYGWLGVSVQDLNKELAQYFGLKEPKGAVVIQVFKNSPASKAGFKEKDVIVEFDNKKVNSTRDLVRLVSNTEPGKEVEVVVYRKKRKVTLRVKIGKRPEHIKETYEIQSENMWRGMEVETITPKVAQSLGLKDTVGVYVVFVEPGSPADKAGIMRGDVIKEVDDKRVYSKEDFFEAVKGKKGIVLLKTNRGYIPIGE